MKQQKQQIWVALSEYEMKLLQNLERTGLKRSEILRMGLRLYHKKELPGYILQKELAEADKILTPKQRCEKEGGKIGKDKDGIDVCQFKQGGLTRNIPLTQYKNEE